MRGESLNHFILLQNITYNMIHGHAMSMHFLLIAGPATVAVEDLDAATRRH